MPRGPFVQLECTAIPRDLIETELFGAVKGAYTSSLVDREGLAEKAAAEPFFWTRSA